MSRVNSWEVSDVLWSRVEPLIPVPERDPTKIYHRKPGAGRKPLPARRVFAGIIYVLRTGCHWKAVPDSFGSGSAIHAYFQRWERAGVFVALWRAGLAEYDELAGIAWDWQSIDAAMVKAPLAQGAVGRNPTDRGKQGTKRHQLVDGRGVPLSLVLTGANRHDVTQLEAVLDRVMAPRPMTGEQHLCADAAYRGQPAQDTIVAHGYTPHVRPRGEEAKQTTSGHKARRWVVEAAHAWLNRFRKLLVRYEKNDENYLALIHIACAITCWRKVWPIYG
jgi:putative transposase